MLVGPSPWEHARERDLVPTGQQVVPLVLIVDVLQRDSTAQMIRSVDQGKRDWAVTPAWREKLGRLLHRLPHRTSLDQSH